MKDYYCLLTHGYETEECYTPNEPFEKIEAPLPESIDEIVKIIKSRKGE